MSKRRLPLLLGLAALSLAAACSDTTSPGDDTSDPVGSITIDPSPDEISAPWTLVGPDDDTAEAAGDSTLADLAVGEYTVTWGEVMGYVTPAPETQELVADATVTFTGEYLESSGTIQIDIVPDETIAPWTLLGPDDETYTGEGDSTLTALFPGEYAIEWGAVGGWHAPTDSTATLANDATVVFTAAYVAGNPPPGDHILVPPATVTMPISFTMGSTVGSDEVEHEVTLTRRVTMGATEVTNGQYAEVLQWAYDEGLVLVTGGVVRDNVGGSIVILLGLDDPHCRIAFDGAVFTTDLPGHPVVEVSWYGAAAYCDWLSERAGYPQAYDHVTWECNVGDPYGATGYRLPTEAEWESACRAGTTTTFSTGACLDAETEANYDGQRPYGDCPAGPYVGATREVASYAANTWGLYDLHGNVWEWCDDVYVVAYQELGELDPVSNGGAEDARVLRGGSWLSGAALCRSACRLDNAPSAQIYNDGFRVVRSVDQSDQG